MEEGVEERNIAPLRSIMQHRSTLIIFEIEYGGLGRVELGTKSYIFWGRFTALGYIMHGCHTPIVLDPGVYVLPVKVDEMPGDMVEECV